jgi:hypothetical protein
LREILWEISWQNLLMYSMSVNTGEDEKNEKKEITIDELELMLK